MRPLYCDESIWVPIADGLRRRGWQVRIARDEGMLGKPDRAHLELANEQNWVLVTFDDDFLSLVEAEDLRHTGIIFVKQHGRTVGEVVKAVDGHLNERSTDDYDIHYL